MNDGIVEKREITGEVNDEVEDKMVVFLTTNGF